MAHNPNTCWDNPKNHTLVQSRFAKLSLNILKHRIEFDAGQRERPSGFADAQCLRDAIELIDNFGSCAVTVSQILTLLSGKATGKPSVGAQNDLKWLSEIVTRHGKQGGLELDNSSAIVSTSLTVAAGICGIHTIDSVSDRPCLRGFKSR
ncbi:MAG TPA: hypothetical protein VNR11_01890 [Xanthobacteraceae bacterium]|nr:hypothetical protein [Xanthobacteraceae bacterium]